MASIDDGDNIETYLTMQRKVNRPHERIEEITRPFVDGIALRRMGVRGQPFYFNLIVPVDNTEDLVDKITATKAFVGKIVTVTDDLGIEIENLAITSVQETYQPISRAVGSPYSGATILITFQCEGVLTDVESS